MDEHGSLPRSLSTFFDFIKARERTNAMGEKRKGEREPREGRKTKKDRKKKKKQGSSPGTDTQAKKEKRERDRDRRLERQK